MWHVASALHCSETEQQLATRHEPHSSFPNNLSHVTIGPPPAPDALEDELAPPTPDAAVPLPDETLDPPAPELALVVVEEELAALLPVD
jgi:hypothetical protein